MESRHIWHGWTADKVSWLGVAIVSLSAAIHVLFSLYSTLASTYGPAPVGTPALSLVVALGLVSGTGLIAAGLLMHRHHKRTAGTDLASEEPSANRRLAA